jgi:hypothetical protein
MEMKIRNWMNFTPQILFIFLNTTLNNDRNKDRTGAVAAMDENSAAQRGKLFQG